MQMGMVDRGAPVQWCSQFPEEAEILFAPLTGCEVVGMPKVEKSVIVVELRLNCNLHDLTIEQILAKMQKTHFDLLDIVRTDLTQLGFPQEAYQAFREHEAELKSKDSKWFNAAANYLSVTKEALQCKLKACSYVMQQEQSESMQSKAAVKILLNSEDAMALEHGIIVIAKEGLQERYASELEAVSASENLQKLSLNLKGAGLKGQIPQVLMRICSKSMFFDLSDNELDFPNEFGGMHTYLRQVTEHVHNIQAVVKVDLRNRDDLIDVDGLQYYEKLASLNLSSCSAVQGVERMKGTVAILNDVQTLLSLDLSQNKLGSAEAEVLAHGITKWKVLTSLDLSRNDFHMKEIKTIASALKGNQAILSLNLSVNKLCGVWTDSDGYQRGAFDSAGLIMLADAIKGMGVLSVANVLGNKIGKEQLGVLQEIMCSKPNLVSLCGITDDATEADLSGLGMDANDAVVLVSELPYKALSSLNLASNNIGGSFDRHGTFTATPEGPAAIANTIKYNAGCALSKLIFGGDVYYDGNEWVEPEPAALELGMTEVDLSNKGLQAAGAIIVAAWITHKDNRALTSANLLKNKIGIAQAHTLVSILKKHPTLKSLCGNKGDETELDMSSKMDGAGDVIMLAAEIIDNGAMTSMDISSNNLGQLVPPEGWRSKDNDDQAPWIHTDGRKIQSGMPKGSKPEGAIALANAIPNMEALSSLNLADNNVGQLVSEGGWIIDDAYSTRYRNPDGKNHTNEKPEDEDFKPRGFIVIANVIPDMEALSIVNVMGNNIGKEQLGKLQEIMRSKPNLVSLCGIADDATEVDLSGLGMDADDAVILASELPDKGALAKLDISSNCIGAGHAGPLQRICVAGDIELAL
jgi:hypothetical protein